MIVVPIAVQMVNVSASVWIVHKCLGNKSMNKGLLDTVVF